MEKFNVPIALFIFKRAEKAALIIDQISKIQPSKIYLIGDGPRNESEVAEVEACRALVESHITWDCEVVRNYAEKNRGVYQNIAGGANWVFEREERAIFLEDDNFPAISFFEYCENLLDKYNDDTRVLWICGTNYMEEYQPEDGSDYVFTQLMLPCGWASWSHKFPKFYDGSISLYREKYIKERVQKIYRNKLMYEHDFPTWDDVIRSIDQGKNPISWDYQMAFALRINNMFGIAPKYNLIRNIGADIHSIHGGVSMDNIMTSRFCEVPIKELSFPLQHPRVVCIDNNFEQKTEKIIIFPLKYRIRIKCIKILKKILFINEEDSLLKTLKNRLGIKS